MVRKVITVSGCGIPLIGNDIDTDRIIPARFLCCVTFDGLEKHTFADDRESLKGQHPFDLPQYKDARILIVNCNFGCGSSREHAPQALKKWGIQALIGESFAEIFFGNCVAIGIPCVNAESNIIKKLQEIIIANPQVVMKVNLETMEVTCGEFVTQISMGEEAKKMIISGAWDTCSQLLSQRKQIQATAANLPYLGWN
ncbi:3-isopropylmalate dehydratase small subunit [Richelia intracellularis HH01]|uniref:3-isopropylmalate dehydratase small subunit n=1 Tax=Richelia intracellularis HH01 TaxID=1165094 RepID=M1X4H8_9NOST|nr:3-isopropylmalate dehydratase small subunit [Richelia intracellularis]CCH66186.1 3-isopropylmalate dehydratase small subunit [Richelia intracellularis HH01]